MEPLHSRDPQLRIVALTGSGSIASAIQAVRVGAFDCLTKPVDAALQGVTEGTSEPTVLSLTRLEWEHLQRLLHDTDQNISETARRLGIDRSTPQRKLSKYPASA